MKKRIIAVLLGSLLVFPLVGCGGNSTDGGNSTEIITLPNETVQSQKIEVESASKIFVFKTEKSAEYLAFLESFDESNNEILGITTCMYTGAYTSSEFYMVTYKKLDEHRESKSTGKVSIFRTKSEEDYCNYLANFDETHYEILGTTTSMYTGAYTNGEFYMVTFRELN